MSDPPAPPESRPPRRPVRRTAGWLFIALLGLYLANGIWHVWKPLPDGLDTAAPARPARNVAWLADRTWVDDTGARHTEQVIFDEMFRLIGQARRLVVVDMFLFNDFQGAVVERHRPLSDQLTGALVRRKRQVPGLRAILITDPVNTVYGGLRSPHLQELRDAGIEVIMTDLGGLRDSNPSWSAFWRLCCGWLGNDPEGGWLDSPMGDEAITLRSVLALLNFKANHRKTLVVDEGDTWTGLVTSANPHDASSAHGNSALRFSGRAAIDLLETERAVARMSGKDFNLPPALGLGEGNGDARVSVLTEAAIRDALLETVNATGPGDRLRIAVFYFSHRELIEAVLAAQARGVDIRIILDPNKDAFGREKSGIPNRQVAAEFHEAEIPVRWCDTHGEQCHAKMLMSVSETGEAVLIQGSANFTRRNLDNYNLETNVMLEAQVDHAAISSARVWFEERWENRDGRGYTVDYAAYGEDGWLKELRYRFMEWSGWSTF